MCTGPLNTKGIRGHNAEGSSTARGDESQSYLPHRVMKKAWNALVSAASKLLSDTVKNFIQKLQIPLLPLVFLYMLMDQLFLSHQSIAVHFILAKFPYWPLSMLAGLR